MDQNQNTTNDNWNAIVLRKKIRGIDPRDVEQLRANALNRINALVEENNKLKAYAANLETRLKASGELEEKMKRMLAEMETTSSKIIEQSRSNAASVASQSEFERKILLQNAKEEAAVVIRDAEKKAERIIAESMQKVQSLFDQIGLLHSRRVALIARFKGLLLSQIDFLESLQEHVREPFDETPQTTAQPGDGLGIEDLRVIIQQLDTLQDTPS